MTTPRADAYAELAEPALLSAIAYDNRLLADCGALAQHPEWLYRDAHQAVAATLFEHIAQGKPIDLLLLPEALKQAGRRERVGDSFADIAAIAGQADGFFTSAGVQEYAQQIIACAEERHIYEWTQRQMIALNRFAGPAEQRALLEARERDLAQFHEGPAAAIEAQTARELAFEEIAPAEWAVPDLFAEGLTLLAGGPKKGKSSLALQVLMAIGSGGKALGKIEVRRGEALYLALEDNKRRMQHRMLGLLEYQHSDAPKGLFIRYDWPRLDAGGIEQLDLWMDQHPATRIIAIDTNARIKPQQMNKNATLYDSDYASLLPLQQWASRRHVAMVVICHTRKASAENAIDEISGSTGLTGVADNIIVMRREGQIAQLHRVGRDYEDDTVWGLKGDPVSLRWTYEGDAVSLKRSAERQTIIDLLLKVSPRGLTPSEIAAHLSKPAATIRLTLHRMITAGDTGLRNDRALGLYYASSLSKEEVGETGETPETGETGETVKRSAKRGGVSPVSPSPSGGETPLTPGAAYADALSVSPVSPVSPHAAPDVHAVPGANGAKPASAWGAPTRQSVCKQCGERDHWSRDASGNHVCENCLHIWYPLDEQGQQKEV